MQPFHAFCTPGPANPVKHNGFETVYSLKFGKLLKSTGFYNVFCLPEPQEEAKMSSKRRPIWGSRLPPRWGPTSDTLGSQKWPFRSRGSTNSRNPPGSPSAPNPDRLPHPTPGIVVIWLTKHLKLILLAFYHNTKQFGLV